MRKVDLKEVYQMACDARDSIWEQARGVGKEPQIMLHWTAGHYANGKEWAMYLDDYHVAIDADGSIYVDHDFNEVLQHTWRRNTGSVGVTLPGGYGSGSNDLGDEPPTSEQIENMALVIYAIAEGLGISVDKTHVLTHGEAANNEDGNDSFHNPYAWWNDSYGDGDTRGDLEYLGTDESPSYNPYATDGSRGGDVLRGKANWYKNQNALNL